MRFADYRSGFRAACRSGGPAEILPADRPVPSAPYSAGREALIVVAEFAAAGLVVLLLAILMAIVCP